MKSCPKCAVVGAVNLVPITETRVVDTDRSLLRGTQQEIQTRPGYALVCQACGMFCPGDVEGLVLADDGKTIVAGHFVSNHPPV